MNFDELKGVIMLEYREKFDDFVETWNEKSKFLEEKLNENKILIEKIRNFVADFSWHLNNIPEIPKLKIQSLILEEEYNSINIKKDFDQIIELAEYGISIFEEAIQKYNEVICSLTNTKRTKCDKDI